MSGVVLARITPVTKYATRALVPATPTAAPARPDPFRGPIAAGVAIIGVFFVGLGGWAAVAPLSSAARAPGTVIVDTKRKAIELRDGGIVREILVHDRDKVSAGQVLIRLDDTEPRARLQLAAGRYYGALALAARLQAESAGATEVKFSDTLLGFGNDPEAAQRMEAERAVFRSRLDELDGQAKILNQRDVQLAEEIKGHEGQIAAAGRQLALIHDETTVVNDLLTRGLALKPRLLLLQRQTAEIEGQRSANLALIARARQTMDESKLRIADLRASRRNEAMKQLGDAQKEIYDLVEQLRAAQDVVDRTELHAPEDGIVVDLAVAAPGGVIAAGQTLMEIAPSLDRLVIDAHVEMNDIDEVAVGSAAQVTLLARSRAAPAVDGKVVWVSADRSEPDKLHPPYYDARVEVDETQLAALKNVHLYPGMNVQVMIAAEKRTMLDYLLAPLSRSFAQAFREQ
jgi:HlyD family secretion protein